MVESDEPITDTALQRRSEIICLLRDAFKTATRSLTHGKMRSILTMLGIVIGIASVIILMSIGQSAQDLILNQVQSIGSNLIIIMPGAPSNGKFSRSRLRAQGIVITSLQQEDVDALAARALD